LKAAADADIPVIIADRQISADESLYATWVGSDFKEEGEKAVAWLDNYLKEQNREEDHISIVLLEGTEGAPAAIGRTEGILEAVAEHPNWEIVARKVANFTQGDGQTSMEEILESMDAQSIDVIISENDNMIFGAMKALDKHNISYGPEGDIIMISFDALHEAFEKMMEGKQHLSVECNPLLAANVEDVILKLERGETLEKMYYTEEGVFSYVDAAQYIDDRAY
jgi:simple sugar transport system substrate-binding protein